MMPLHEALLLLWFDSIIGTAVIPVQHSYVLTVMMYFTQEYPIFSAFGIATTGVLVGVSTNWLIGKMATSLTKAPMNQSDDTSLNARLTSRHTTLDKIKQKWLQYGHWSLLIVVTVPFLAQACAVLAGWTGIPLKRLWLPSALGAISTYMLQAFVLF